MPRIHADELAYGREILSRVHALARTRPEHAQLHQALTRASRVLDDLAAGGSGVPGRVPVESVSGQRGGAPRSARALQAQFDRDAVLRLRLVDRLVQPAVSPLAVGPRLRPSARRAVEDGVAWWQKEAAEDFFNGRVRPVMEALAAATGDKSWLPDGPYARHSEAALEQWSQLWTRAVSSMAADWIRRVGGGGLRGMLHALCVGNLPSFRPTARLVEKPEGGAVLPGESEPRRAPSLFPVKHAVFADLHGDAWLCCLLDDVRWARETPGPFGAVVDLASKCLGPYQDRGRYFDGGKNVGQVYLATWIASADAGHDPLETVMPADAPMPSLPPASLPVELESQVPAGQWRTVALAVQGPRPPVARSQTRFAGATAGPSRPGPAPLARAVVAMEPATESPWLCSLRLWDRLDEVHWIDLAVVARADGKWWALNISLNDIANEGRADDADCRTWLAVDGLPSHITWERLVAALRSGGPITWAREYEGGGVFVACAIDLDAG